MKKRFLAAMASSLVLGFATLSFASDFNWSVGVKGWYNDMDYTYKVRTTQFIPGGPGGMSIPIGGTSETKIKFDNALMLGPALKMKYKNFFAGVNYLTTVTDYKNEENNFTPFGVTTAESTGSRNDIDVVLGYMFTPNFGIATGYKGIYEDIDISGVGSVESKKHGIPLVLTANVRPISALPSLALFGSAGYIFFYEDYKSTSTLSGFGSDFKETNTYHAGTAEAGIAYRIVAGLSANVSYKYQYLAGDRNETYKGVAFGVDYNF